MSNILNEIHYAVTIKTNSLITDSTIGLVDGQFNFITDLYDPVGNTFEDLTPVNLVCNTSLLNYEGISTSAQSIDLSSGGDFSFLASLDIQLINTDNIHKKLTSTNDLYLVGSDATLYVIIDGVWYSRWVGAVSGYNFNDDEFTFQCEDKNSATNQVINGVVYGRTYITPIITTPDSTTAIVKDAPVNMFFPFDGSVVGYDAFTPESRNYVNERIVFFSGGATKYKNLLSTEKRIEVRLNGKLETYYSEIEIGSFMKFDGDDNFYEISEIYGAEYYSETPDVFYLTCFVIEEKPLSFSGYEQFFGEQGGLASTDINDATEGLIELEGTAKIFVSIFPNSAYIDLTGKEFVKTDGKYEAVDETGKTVFISGKETDNQLNLTSNKQYEFIYPIDVKEWRYYSKPESDEFATLVDSGKCFHLENYGTTLNTLGWNNVNNEEIKTDNYNKITQYLLMTFDQDINETIPFIGLNSISKGLFNWLTGINPVNGAGTFLDTMISEPSIPSRYDPYPATSNYVDLPITYVRSFFQSWEVDVYRVCDAGVYGEMPYYLTTVVIPNVRKQLSTSITDTELYEGQKIVRCETQTMTGTNLPYESFTVDNMFSTTNGVENYSLPGLGSIQPFVWPFAQVELNDDPIFNLPAEVTATNKLLFRIRVTPNQETTEADATVSYITFDGTQNQTTSLIMDGRESAIFGLHSLGVYKEQIIADNLKFKTISENSDLLTIPGVITELIPLADVSGIPNRNNWNVGLNINEETNKYSIITELCKQSFIGGITKRDGTLMFREFIERLDANPDYSYDDETFIDKSLGDFKTTDLSKLYNDFTIKYHSLNDNFKKSYEIHKVDQPAFPSYDEFYYDWSDVIVTTGDGLFWKGSTQQVVVDSTRTPDLLAILLSDKYSSYKFLDFNGTTIEFIDPIRNAISPNGQLHYFSVTLIPDVPYALLSNIAIDEFYYNKDERGAVWSSEYVIGISSYPDAKELWEIAHQSWLINKQILIAPSDRSQLKYSIDLNSFYNETNYDSTSEYAYEYLKMFLSWTTRQKLLVNFNLPITTETIKLELLDRVNFSDSLITPEVGEYGKGIIRSLQLDTKKFQIKVGVIFEPLFMMPPTIIQLGDIIETGYNIIDIIETGSNVDNIIED